jgi:hypothetical protein
VAGGAPAELDILIKLVRGERAEAGLRYTFYVGDRAASDPDSLPFASMRDRITGLLIGELPREGAGRNILRILCIAIFVLRCTKRPAI